MSVQGNPFTIHDSSLVLSLDAANIKSYVGSGTSLADLSGNGYNGVLYNGPTFNAANGGYVAFDGTNDYLGVSPTGNRLTWTPSGTFGLNNMSIEFWINSTDGSGRILSKPWNNNGEYNYWVNGSSWYVYTSGTNFGINFTSLLTGAWEHVVCIATPTQLAVYRNGVLNAAFTNHGLTGNTATSGDGGIDLTLMTLYPYGQGWGGDSSFSIQGGIASVKMYNRVLTSSEILQNYNAVKSKFGL